MAPVDRGDVGVPPAASAWDVFVSYAHADVDAVSALVAGLRDSGLTVWWDRDRIDTFDGITSLLEEGIAGARVVVMRLSETYPRARSATGKPCKSCGAYRRVRSPPDCCRSR